MCEHQLNITRSKMDKLKRIMEERRAKREARRLQAQARPYSTAWSVKPEASAATAAAAGAGGGKHVENATAAEEPESFIKPEPEPVTA